MSLERIDQYIGELEALKEYKKVRKERDELSLKVGKLENALSAEKDQVERLSQEKREFATGFEEKKEEARRSAATAKANHEELQRKEKEAKDLRNRVEELEALKVTTDGITLKEAKDLFLKSKEESVRKEGELLSKQLQLQWENSDKPMEVRSEAIRLLKFTIDHMQRGQGMPEGIVDAGLHKNVRDILNIEVQKRIDEEFSRRVEASSEQKANQKLEDLTRIEWPNWYNMSVTPNVIDLESKIVTSVLNGFS